MPKKLFFIANAAFTLAKSHFTQLTATVVIVYAYIKIPQKTLCKNNGVSEVFTNFATSTTHAEPPAGVKGGRDTYTLKGVSGRFGFDVTRISHVQTICQEQSNVNAPWDVSYTDLGVAVCYNKG